MAESGWQWLLPELLEEIAGRLVTEADHVHMHQVCAHWRASTALPSATRRPWLVAAIRPWRRTSPVGAYSVWHLDGVGRVDLQGASPPAGVPRCCGMPRGWLALTDDDELPTRLVLWDPTSGAEIELPPLRSVLQVFLSGDPLSSPAAAEQQQWMALASQQIVPRANLQKTYFWRPGDASWSLMTPPNPDYCTSRIESVAFHDGKLIFVDWQQLLVVYDLNIIGAGTTPPAPAFFREVHLRHQAQRLCRCERPHTAQAVHAVECNGDLLLVVLWQIIGHPFFAEVYKPPAAEWTAERRQRWLLEFGERVTDLGGYSLFLGRGDGFAVHAQDFPLIRGNCVYYARHDHLCKTHWVEIFDLESDVLQRIPCPPQYHMEEGISSCWPYSWFCLKRPFLKE
uniref:KIB1-4 beta-propeller domain-containing protein n=1 Tax=Oryza punctata TaxID=4537 RepID=A0A0E0M9T3_ORYPU